MALPVRQQITYWSIAAAVFFGALWLLSGVLTPFIVGGALAYCLDPVADRLEKMGFSRVLATVVIFVFLILIFTLAAFIVVPLLIQQLAGLVSAAPEIIENATRFLLERFPSLGTLFPELGNDQSNLAESFAPLAEALQTRGADIVQTLLSSAASVVNVLVFFVVVPVVAFYLLLDWDNMIARIDQLLPRDHAPVIRELATQIDSTLASFVRGQGTVCLILGTFYAVALMIVGLQYGLIVGLMAGLLTFIPYVGALVGGLLSIGLALFQFWGEWWMILIVAAIFQVGQMVEGNILTPKLVGSSVGLHPVWLIFALSAFGAVFGFVGLLVAVPVAAMIGVLVRYFITRYQEGLLYRGVEALQDGQEDEGEPRS